MFDLWAPEHSVLREKVVEHIFIAELSKALLLDLAVPFEILRAEFDANGYDVAIEAGGLLRHVQLKATTSTGRRASVDVQLALADKPAGCVVWIFVDPQSLEVGPFLWFGGERGRPLPPIGDREVRHSRGNASGTKKVRGGLRRLPKGEFTRFDTIHELAIAMFPPMRESDILTNHLRRRSALLGIGQLAASLTWNNSAPIAHMIDGYALAAEVGIKDPVAFVDRMRTEAERCGRWEGSALELWLALFIEHRRDHFSGPVGVALDPAPPPLHDELCAALSDALSTLSE